MAAWRYIYLLSSLPALPLLRAARRLPIGEQRLRSRLALLEPRDACVLEETLDLVAWRRQPPGESDAQTIARLRRAAEGHPVAAVREIVGFRLETRLIVAALRYRHAGYGQLPAPLAGAGALAARLRRRYTEPDFGFGAARPWIAEVRRFIENGDWPASERRLLAHEWAHLVGVDQRAQFALENVLAYVLKWDILARALASDRARAAQRFATLLDEALGERLAVLG